MREERERERKLSINSKIVPPSVCKEHNRRVDFSGRRFTKITKIDVKTEIDAHQKLLLSIRTVIPPRLPGNEDAEGSEPGCLFGPQRLHVAQGAVQRGKPCDVPLLPTGHDATAASRRVGDPRPDPVARYNYSCVTLLQSVFSALSQGLDDDILQSSIGRWADTIATYCPCRPMEYSKMSSSKPCDRAEKTLCTVIISYHLSAITLL